MTVNVNIDADVLRDAMNDKGIVAWDLSQELGYSETYITECMMAGSMPLPSLKLLCYNLGIDPDDAIRRDYDDESEDVDVSGYQVSIESRPGVMSMTVKKDGKKRYIGRSKIKGDSEMDVMQAISYAAHMAYKLSEQEYLKEKSRRR